MPTHCQVSRAGLAEQPLWKPVLGWVRIEPDPSGIPPIDLADLGGTAALAAHGGR